MLVARGSASGKRAGAAGPDARGPIDRWFISNHSAARWLAVAAAVFRGVGSTSGLDQREDGATIGVTVHDAWLPKTQSRVVIPAELMPGDGRRARFPALMCRRRIKKTTAPPPLTLESTPDILASTKGARRAGSVIVGFALETNDVVANGRKKLASKELDLIVVNDATETGAGFGVDTNRVTLLLRDGGEERLPLMPKTAVADAILDRVETLIRGR